MIIWALDLGTRTGWAIGNGDACLSSGFSDFKNSRYEGGGMRFLRFRQWLSEMLRNCDGQCDALYYEEVRRHRGTDAAHVYGGLQGALTAWCEEHRIPYQGIPVGTIKKHATGKGKADKTAMVACAQMLGLESEDDNEADAWWLLDYAMMTNGGVA